MVSVQRSIEIRVPVHTLYSQLTQFEEYPQFMKDIESVEQRDDTHLHWMARMSDRSIEWDATITECVPDHCIAWQSETGPNNAGRVELQPVGPAASRLTLTLVSEMELEPTTPAGDIKAELSERIWEDLTRLRSLVENRSNQDRLANQHGQAAQGGMSREAARAGEGQNAARAAAQETGAVANLGIAQGTGQAGSTGGREGIDEVAKLGSIEGSEQGDGDIANHAVASQRAVETMQRDRGSPGNPVPASGFAAGSEGFSGNEDPSSPVLSASHMGDQGSDPASSGTGAANSHISELSRAQDKTAQSDYSLSKGAEGRTQGDRDSIAEEVSFDQQSESARGVGQFPTDDPNGTNEGIPTAEVIAKAAQRRRPEPEV
ncbi:SRPBCC family protein [Oxalobacteraceae bacterium R-40]|uniref:SRPBCC family protein n=1 Tax=Keguizhuia sedimenti TaxID=3064264 RepID=A0ABU1BS83_9BURK|nr:SRPBCC family protein [Oxalobacteraceae bacterium R-40]